MTNVKIKEALISQDGYSKGRLLAVLAIADKPLTAVYVGDVARIAHGTSARRMGDGEFTRSQIARLIQDCKMTKIQVIRTFFDGLCVDDEGDLDDLYEKG